MLNIHVEPKCIIILEGMNTVPTTMHSPGVDQVIYLYVYTSLK